QEARQRLQRPQLHRDGVGPRLRPARAFRGRRAHPGLTRVLYGPARALASQLDAFRTPPQGGVFVWPRGCLAASPARLLTRASDAGRRLPAPYGSPHHDRPAAAHRGIARTRDSMPKLNADEEAASLRAMMGAPAFMNLHEIVAKARQNLNQNDWDYIVGATESETTLRRNRMGLDSIAFRPRVLRDVSSIDTAVTVFGRTLRLPIVLAPVGS